MKTYFLCASIALCLFSLWAIGRYDWLRLTRRSCRVEARVTGFRSLRDSDGISFAAVYTFSIGGAAHEVVDAVHSTVRRPPEGTAVMLAYPEGRPDLARPPRVLMWLAVYALLLGLAGFLTAKLAGKI
ncbi:hypothetical protein [Novosphingobium lentum]|uniref:hypothetical protein n=1 Tax=Novosphingobium lentum TaxID=145287 RepID=UPI00082CC339|nr:hypothetical protein [Novosphingobium lentum]